MFVLLYQAQIELYIVNNRDLNVYIVWIPRVLRQDILVKILHVGSARHGC